MDNLTNYIIRPLHPNEYHLLKEFLYEAIYIPEGVKPPAKENCGFTRIESIYRKFRYTKR